MHGLTHNNSVSILSILERVKALNSDFNSALTELFSVQQNQVEVLRKLGFVQQAPTSAQPGDSLPNGGAPEPYSSLDALSRELDKFQGHTKVLESLIEDGRFIDQALFNQNVIPESQKLTQASPMGAMASTQVGGGIDSASSSRLQYQPGAPFAS